MISFTANSGENIEEGVTTCCTYTSSDGTSAQGCVSGSGPSNTEAACSKARQRVLEQQLEQFFAEHEL